MYTHTHATEIAYSYIYSDRNEITESYIYSDRSSVAAMAAGLYTT